MLARHPNIQYPATDTTSKKSRGYLGAQNGIKEHGSVYLTLLWSVRSADRKIRKVSDWTSMDRRRYSKFRLGAEKEGAEIGLHGLKAEAEAEWPDHTSTESVRRVLVGKNEVSVALRSMHNLWESAMNAAVN